MQLWILEALQAAWRWIVDAIATFTSSVMALMGSLINDVFALCGLDGVLTSGVEFGQEATSWMGALNQWVPFDTALCCVGAYWLFVAGFISIKYTLKLIPTIG